MSELERPFFDSVWDEEKVLYFLLDGDLFYLNTSFLYLFLSWKYFAVPVCPGAGSARTVNAHMYQKCQTLALASPFSHIPSHPLFVCSYISLSVSQMKHFSAFSVCFL